ncbi:MAG TPA: hypothetical protein PLO41_08305, partial [Rubrivivax sp.]|nr:hypothetical protein [Rubrivivax sp.]
PDAILTTASAQVGAQADESRGRMRGAAHRAAPASPRPKFQAMGITATGTSPSGPGAALTP